MAMESINGFWNVTSIDSYYGEFITNGHNGLTTVRNEGNLGSFKFEQNGQVKYKFLRNDTIYQDPTNWVLKSGKELTVGFRATKYTVEVSTDYNFKVMFGDGSKNEMKDARKMELVHWPDKLSYGVGFVMTLSKQ
jgi:hypothetical protein